MCKCFLWWKKANKDFRSVLTMQELTSVVTEGTSDLHHASLCFTFDSSSSQTLQHYKPAMNPALHLPHLLQKKEDVTKRNKYIFSLPAPEANEAVDFPSCLRVPLSIVTCLASRARQPLSLRRCWVRTGLKALWACARRLGDTPPPMSVQQLTPEQTVWQHVTFITKYGNSHPGATGEPRLPAARIFAGMLFDKRLKGKRCLPFLFFSSLRNLKNV